MNSDRLLRQSHDVAVLLPFHCEQLRLRRICNRGPKPCLNRDQNRDQKSVQKYEAERVGSQIGLAIAIAGLLVQLFSIFKNQKEGD